MSAQDHHYHFGYFVVTAAILAKLKPEWKNNTDFVDFVTSSADGHGHPREITSTPDCGHTTVAIVPNMPMRLWHSIVHGIVSMVRRNAI